MKNSNHLRQEKEIRLFHNLMATESSHGGFDRLELEGKNVGASMIMHHGSAGESQDCSKVVNSNIQALNNSILAESDVKSRDPGVRLLIEEVKLDGYLKSKKGYKMNKDDDLVFKLGKPSIEKKQWEMAKSPEEEHPIKAFGWAARDPSGFLSPFKFSRRATGEGDVRLKILYCGVCHSDLHFIKNEWGYSTYPIVPGHEIVGIVTEVGSKVRKFKIGDKVGVGCMVGACHTCEECNNDVEQYCAKQILTYNSPYFDGTITYGGYSDEMVALERYCVRFPENMSLAAGAPLLCAGITVYSPLMYYGLNKPGMHVGVAGLGGLGHVAVKFAKALGLKVTVISTSVSKKEEAMKRLGADSFLASRDPEQMQAAMRSMDGIIDTVSAVHPLLPLFGLLKTNGKLVMLGAPEKPLELSVFPLLTGRKMVAGSGIGGMKETQEMVDFAAKHNITADIELIPMDYINTAMERLARGDVRYRFVLDIGNTLAATKP